MKGKVSFYFDAPNTSKVRTRINPTPEFTQKLRVAIQETIVEVCNEHTYAIRTKLIQKFANMGEVVKDEKYAAQLNSALSSFFDVHCQMTPFSKEGNDEEDGIEGGEGEPEEAAGEGEPEATAETKAEGKKAPKAPKPKKDDDDFNE